jgi:hypothetical protein
VQQADLHAGALGLHAAVLDLHAGALALFAVALVEDVHFPRVIIALPDPKNGATSRLPLLFFLARCLVKDLRCLAKIVH